MFRLPELDPCPFCENVAGRPVRSPFDGELVRCAVIEEHGETLAFVNTRRPAAFAGADHPAPWVLVIPKRHAPTLLDLSTDEAAAVMAHAHRMARAMAAAFPLDGLRLLQNNGVAADQTVPHVHLHLIPCRLGGASRMGQTNERGPRVPLEERAGIADRIRARLRD